MKYTSPTLTGKDGTETSKFSLDKYFHNDFKRGETDTYNVTGDDVGDIAMITLNNDGLFKSNWFIDKVIVEKEVEGGSEKYEFPCYRWDSHHLVVYEGKGTVISHTGCMLLSTSCLFPSCLQP